MLQYALLTVYLSAAFAAAYPAGQCVVDCYEQRPFKQEAFALPGQQCAIVTQCGAKVYAGR